MTRLMMVLSALMLAACGATSTPAATTASRSLASDVTAPPTPVLASAAPRLEVACTSASGGYDCWAREQINAYYSDGDTWSLYYADIMLISLDQHSAIACDAVVATEIAIIELADGHRLHTEAFAGYLPVLRHLCDQMDRS